MAAQSKSILIISIDLKEQEMLEDYSKQMSASGKFQMPTVQTTGSFGQDAAWWSKNSPDLLIVNLPEEAFLQNQFLLKLKNDVPKTIPLLLTCDVISSGIMQMTSIFSKVRIVKTPLEHESFFRGLSDLFASFQPGRQQAAPRFPTNQVATVTKDDVATKMTVVLKNMSNSGAYFETKTNELNLAIGQLVSIQIQIAGVREYTFGAKVVWYKALENGEFGFGVTFTDPQS